MKLKKHFLIVLLIFQYLLSFSQQFNTIWQQCFYTENTEARSYCIENFNNGYLVGIQVNEEGEGVSNYHGGADAWFICLDSLGNMLWERCYGGSGGEIPLKIVPINEQYYYLVNLATSTDGDVLCENKGEADVWVVKIDTAGNIIWQNCYGGPDFERPRDAILTPDGGLLFMSRIFDNGGDISNFYGLYDNWVCKLDSRGNIEWETTIGSPGRDNGLRLLFTSDSTYIALCSVNDNGGMSECELTGAPIYSLDLWLVEIDMDGNILRQDCYGGTGWDLGIDIVETSDGFAIASSTDSQDLGVNNNGLYDFWLLKINKNREIMWQNCLGGSSWETPMYLTHTQDNGFILIGGTNSNDKDVSGNHSVGGGLDVWMVKTDSTGELMWQQCFGGRGDENPYTNFNVAKKSDYSFTLVPNTNGPTDVGCDDGPDYYNNWIFQIKDCSHYQPTTPQKPTGKNYLCVNTDSITTYVTQVAPGAWYYEWELTPLEAGTLVIDSITAQIHWSPTYEGQTTIKVRSDNDCGTSAWSDGLIVQTYICLGTEENNTNSNFLSVYPNPASSTLTVNYNKPVHKTLTTIEIFDIYGTVVTAQNMEAQKQKTVLDISRLAASLYFVRVIEDGILIGVKKVVVE